MRNSLVGIFAVGFLVFGCLPRAQAQTAAEKYHITPLGTLGGKTSYAYAINASGQIAGSAEKADGRKHAILFSDGKMLDLGTLGGDESEAFSLNNSGQVVGQSDIKPVVGDANFHAFLYDHNKMQDLGTLGGQISEAHGINSAGDIVGSSVVVRTGQAFEPPPGRAFIYHNGKMTGIVDGPGHARSINDAGQVAGTAMYRVDPGSPNLITRATVFDSGKMKDLGLPTNRVSAATCINASGQAAGTGILTEPGAGVKSQSHAFLYTLGTTQDLGTLGGETSRAFGISKSGMVVGSADSASYGLHAFLFDGDKMLDLNERVDPAELATAGFKTLTMAFGMNDGGQIVGIGKDAKGNEIAFLLTPVSVTK